MFDLLRQAESFVDPSSGAVRPQRLGLKLCKQAGVEPEVI